MDSYLPKDFDLGRFMFAAAHAGITTDARIKCVLIAYEKALEDPKAAIPTALHAAIEGLRRV